MISSIRLIAFKAVEYPKIAQEMHEGHKNRLAGFNIRSLASLKHTWLTNPNVYCICAIDEEHNEVLGSIRIHVADAMYCLPIEEALSPFGNDMRPWINQLEKVGRVVESCGLWCSGASLVKKINLSAKLLAFETTICRYLNVVYCFGLVPNHNLDLTFSAGFIKHQQFPHPFSYPDKKYQSWVLYKRPMNLKESTGEAELKILIDDSRLVAVSEFESETVRLKCELLNFDFCVPAPQCFSW